MPLPYLKRRRLLTELLPDDGCWTVPAHRESDGRALLDAVTERGLEGIMAKRVDSPYLPGKRSSSWIKVKARLRQEFVIGGLGNGGGGRGGGVGCPLGGGCENGRGGGHRASGKGGS